MKIFQRINTIKNTSKATLNKMFLRYLVFLGISLILWYMNALNGQYASDIKFPVKYLNPPADKVLINELPSHLTLLVQASGFDLLKYKASAPLTTLYYDLSSSSILTRKKSSGWYYSLTNQFLEQINFQLSGDAEIISVTPDTLYMQFDSTIKKKISITPVLSVEYEKQYFPKGKPVLTPDSVWVEGPTQILDTLNTVFTQNYSHKKTTDTLSFSVPLALIPLLSYHKNEVNISIPVERHTEAELEVPIEVENVPENYRVRLFPGKVKIQCMVGLSEYEKLNSFQFKVSVDYQQITPNARKLEVNLKRVPQFISQTSFSPESVDFIVEKQ